MPLPTDEEIAQLTPMMKQYFTLKKQVKEAILFFRMGDFYEIFGDDAEAVAPKLQLVLTSRGKGPNQKIPFCGVPHHSAKTYWMKLLKLGLRVCIVDQTEDASQAKGLVKREITRILTPGCIDDLDGLDQERPNYLMAIYQHPPTKIWHGVVVDVSTGEFRWGEMQGYSEIEMMIGTYRPTELVVRRFFQEEIEHDLRTKGIGHEMTISLLPETILRDENQQYGLVRQVFGLDQGKLESLGVNSGGAAIMSAVLQYLIGLRASVDQFLTIRPLREPRTMDLNDIVIRDLELFETSQLRQRKGSLIAEINRTLTPMGARRLILEMKSPLLDMKEIVDRQNVVSIFLKESHLFSDIRDHLSQCYDLDRLATKAIAGRAAPSELVQMRLSLQAAARLAGNLSPFQKKLSVLSELVPLLQPADQIAKELDQALENEAGPLGARLDVFRSGYDASLDQLRHFSQNGEKQLQEYQQSLREQTGINSLKIKNHKTFGLLIEVTKSNLDKVPDSFIRRQTMVNGERYVTNELLELHEQLSVASERAVMREEELYLELLQRMLRHKADLRNVASALAFIDILQSFAQKARDGNYCRPQSLKCGTLNVVGSRHPVVESFVGHHHFVGNNLTLTPQKKQVLITGPNMAGKSTVMRQVALLAILHQMGSYVPASEAQLPVFDNIFTRVGASDHLAQGKSTFMVEMSESATILRKATDRSLVILDEVGRGTSTTDGLAIASAILEEISKKVNCYTLFATHYHELVSVAKGLSSVMIAKTEVVKKDSGLTFTHKLVEGGAEQSYGIEVAKLAGLPPRVLVRAEEYLKKSENHGQSEGFSSQKTNKQPPLAHWGVEEVFSVDDEQQRQLAAKIAKIPIHRTTPLQALNILNDLKAMVGNGTGTRLFDN